MTWNLASTSVTGTRHATRQQPCQDAHAIVQLDNLLIMAVSDGAGSAAHSQTGALLATTTTAAFVAGALLGRRPRPKELATVHKNAVLQTRATIAQHAQQHGHRIGDYATTLLAVVVTNRYIATLQLGDGGIVTCDTRGRLAILTRQQEREYVNEVTFVTCDHYQEELHIRVLPRRNVQAVFVFTDGVESLCVRRASNQPHPGFFHPLLDTTPSSADLTTLLESQRVCDRTDDDKTLVIATTTGA